MSKQVKWFTFSTALGGVVQINTEETAIVGKKKRVLPTEDETHSLDSLSEETQQVMLDALATVADELGYAPANIEEVES